RMADRKLALDIAVSDAAVDVLQLDQPVRALDLERDGSLLPRDVALYGDRIGQAALRKCCQRSEIAGERHSDAVDRSTEFGIDRRLCVARFESERVDDDVRLVAGR